MDSHIQYLQGPELSFGLQQLAVFLLLPDTVCCFDNQAGWFIKHHLHLEESVLLSRAVPQHWLSPGPLAISYLTPVFPWSQLLPDILWFHFNIFPPGRFSWLVSQSSVDEMGEVSPLVQSAKPWAPVQLNPHGLPSFTSLGFVTHGLPSSGLNQEQNNCNSNPP